MNPDKLQELKYQKSDETVNAYFAYCGQTEYTLDEVMSLFQTAFEHGFDEGVNATQSKRKPNYS